MDQGRRSRPVVRRDAGGLRRRGWQLRARGGHQPRDQSLRLRRLRRAASFRHRRPLHSSLRHRGAEEALVAPARHRRARRRDRDDRARHRLRSAGPAHDREEERQRLRAQRRKNLHHQRPARQPDHRRGQDRSGREGEGRLAHGGRDRRRGRLPARAQAQEARSRRRRHVGTLLRRRRAASLEPAAPRRARASPSS